MPQKNTKSNMPNSGYYVKNSGMNAAGAGVLNAPRVRETGKYNDRRLREGEKYYNRRKRIITGKELTTPLARKKAAERTILPKTRIKVKTVAIEKKKFPVSIIFCVLITAFVLLCLICSQIVLNEQAVKINDLNDSIISETKREKVLTHEFDNKNDLSYIIGYAVNELGMINADLLQKHYISGGLNDKAEVISGNNAAVIDLPNIMSAIFGN